MNAPALHLECAGEAGSPVLLLHGIGGSSASFAPQLQAFGRIHRTIAWDAPGYGRSPDPDGAPGIAGYARDAAAILAEHGRAHVVGVSWGGVIATRLAADRPELVRSLTLADSTRGSGLTVESAARMRQRPAELAGSGAAEFARRRAPRLVAPGAAASVRTGVERIMSTVRLPGYRFAAESMAETDHSDLLGALRVRTLVLVGAEDRVTGVAESRRIADAIPCARLEIVPHAGHAANQENPDRVNRLLLEFFAEAERPPVADAIANSTEGTS
ncbi:alpha/beta fold hydrolase [Prauserella alba]|uniref:Alpha/beta fold hydrolase n=1 Tax=Prauserella alba TaxID=176898 RepID=A0ABN1VCI4_9PSEU|nr:alpha/beta hydrolase [Prauserella alba]MCP2178913.1 Pimeloyl-ACP methyl ester carboxylesterase [Prauserella alba]